MSIHYEHPILIIHSDHPVVNIQYEHPLSHIGRYFTIPSRFVSAWKATKNKYQYGMGDVLTLVNMSQKDFLEVYGWMQDNVESDKWLQDLRDSGIGSQKGAGKGKKMVANLMVRNLARMVSDWTSLYNDTSGNKAISIEDVGEEQVDNE